MTNVDVRLDLRGVRCPMNYIKTKLKLDELAAGGTLEVFIDDGEAVRGLPTGLRDEGHEILVTEPVNPGYRVVIRKQEVRSPCPPLGSQGRREKSEVRTE